VHWLAFGWHELMIAGKRKNGIAVLLLAILCGFGLCCAAAEKPPRPRELNPPNRPNRPIAAAPQSDVGLSREIWIGLRQDGQPGEGTLASPFNGTGPGFDAKMIELMQGNAQNLIIHLLPGVFETSGAPTWHPLTGWKIRGAGMDLTTVRYIARSDRYAFAVITTHTFSEADNVEVSHLTVDCNHNPGNSNVVYGIILSGGGNYMHHVKAINGNGIQSANIEWFGLVVFTALEHTNTSGNVIEDCEVSGFKGTYATALGIGATADFGGRNLAQGVCRRNRVLDMIGTGVPRLSLHAYGTSGAKGMVIEDNVAIRCEVSLNIDTGTVFDSIIRGNVFLGCKGVGMLLTGRNMDNLTVEDNLIEMDPATAQAAIVCSDNGGQLKVKNFKIRNNVIRSMNDRFSYYGGLTLYLTPESAATFLITGNRIDGALGNFLSEGNRVRFFDNTDFSGNPITLIPGLGGAQQIHLPYGEGGTLLLNRGNAYLIAEVGADPLANGTNLIQAYARAKAMTPHGQPLSGTNRATVFLYPGKYLLADSALVLDTPFVDLIGLGNARATRLESEGNTVVQSADDVALENLTFHCSSAAIPTFGPQDKAAYGPSDNLSRSVLKNCTFSAANNGWSMRLGVTYAGSYNHCTSGPRGWGGPGNFSGNAVDCQAGEFSFGSGGTFTGAATNCSAGSASFGGGSTGGFHGFAKRCTAGQNSFGGSGQMIDCEVTGAINPAVLTTGRLADCRIGPAPGNQSAILIGPGATLYNCTVLANPAGTGFSIDAPNSVTARVTHCRLNHGLHNVINAIAQPFNVNDPNLE
jgi:hypothetical protein